MKINWWGGQQKILRIKKGEITTGKELFLTSQEYFVQINTKKVNID